MGAMIAVLLRMHHEAGETEMTDAEYARKLDELDRLLNDPDVPMEPAKVWSLLAEIAQRDLASENSGRETA
jgi:hypothetical protein